jgi:hypothetical protein
MSACSERSTPRGTRDSTTAGAPGHDVSVDPDVHASLSAGDKRTAKGKRKAKSFGISRLRNAEIRKQKAAKAE